MAPSPVLLSHGGRVFHLSPAARESIRIHANQRGSGSRYGLLFGVPGDEITVARPLVPDMESDGSLEGLARFSHLFDEPPLNRAGQPLRPLGWYAVRPVGMAWLAEVDLQFHNTLFSHDQIPLMCELSVNGDIAVTVGRVRPGKIGNFLEKPGMVWAVAAACLALLVIAGFYSVVKLAGQRSNSELSRPAASARAPITPNQPVGAVCNSADTADLQRHIDDLEKELSAEITRNRRLEQTLRILRDGSTVGSLRK